jgi:hypothetical protein
MMHAARQFADAPPRLCAVPDCGAVISRESSTGVCITHCHNIQHCGCATCAGRAVVRRSRAAAAGQACTTPGCDRWVQWRSGVPADAQTCRSCAPSAPPVPKDVQREQDVAAVDAARIEAVDIREAQHLFVNVLLAAVSDAVGARAEVRAADRISAINWFDSGDFIAVATFAGYDPAYVRRMIGPRLLAEREKAVAVLAQRRRGFRKGAA